MAKQADANGVSWEVRQVGDAFNASVAADSKTTYLNASVAVDDLAIGKAFLTWPANGEPVIIGTTAAVKPQVAIDAFAKANKERIAARVTERAPPPNTPVVEEPSLLPLLLLVTVIYFADNR